MDYELIKIGITFFNLILTIGVGIVAWSDRKQRATTKSITDLGNQVTEKLNAKCVRISKLESTISGLPTREELVRVHERIDEEYKVLQVKMDSLSKDVNSSSKETTLLIGKLIGQVEQMNRVN